MVIFALATGTAGSALGADPACFLAGSLPPGAYRAETFTFGLPGELAGVQARFAQAVAKKQEWFQAYLARLNLKPGEILPYHEEMGVSRAEYEALTRAYANPPLLPQTTIEVQVDCREGSMRLHAKSPNDFLDRLQIDPDGTLHGPMGLKCSPEAVKSRRAKFGTWSGTSWFFESADAAQGSARTFELAIGKTEEAGRRVLYLEHSLTEKKKPVAADRLLAWLTRAGEQDAAPAGKPEPRNTSILVFNKSLAAGAVVKQEDIAQRKVPASLASKSVVEPDSAPAKEYQETQNKAMAMIKALNTAEEGLE